MPIPFAALKARVNSAVLSHLADEEADFGAGKVVSGLFTKEAIDPFGVVESHQMEFMADASQLIGVSAGMSVTVRGLTYTVVKLRPDDETMTTVVLK
jgi:hypothetical protein